MTNIRISRVFDWCNKNKSSNIRFKCSAWIYRRKKTFESSYRRVTATHQAQHCDSQVPQNIQTYTYDGGESRRIKRKTRIDFLFHQKNNFDRHIGIDAANTDAAMDSITTTNTISLNCDIELTNKVISLNGVHLARPHQKYNNKYELLTRR